VKLERRTLAVLAVAAAVLCLASVAIVVWRVERALGGSGRSVDAGQRLPVAVRMLDAPANPGFESLSTPAVFKAGAAFNGRFYLSGPAGLFVYSPDGSLSHIYRAGLDLPAAPLGQMAVGTLTDGRQPELLIATRGEGVLAFDGQRFRQIRPADAEARQVTAVLPLASGRLLMGTGKLGLLVYDGNTLRRFHTTTNNCFVTAVAGTEAELWIGTANGGVLHWHGGQVERIGEEQGLPDAHVESIAQNGDTVYVGTPVGVAELKQGKVTRVLAGGQYAHALLANGSDLLVGEMEGEVTRISLTGQVGAAGLRRQIALHGDDRMSLDAKGSAASPVEQLFAVGDSRYAVRANGLLREETAGTWKKVLSGGDSLLTDGNVSALMMASDGRMWVGYFDRGLDILPATGGPPKHIESEQIFCVNRIVEDRRTGVVAVATANGLVLFDRDGRQRQVLDRDSGLIANHVTDVALYGDGMVAATPAGITFLDRTGAHSMYAFQGLVNNHVYALGTNRNELLVGTLGGLSLLTDGAVTRNLTTANSGLKHNWITALIPIGGDWLVGTYGAGVLRMDAAGSVSTTDGAADGLVVNPGAMLSDGQLVLAGTLGQGLLVSEDGGTRWKTIAAGLPSLNVTALAAANGVVYVGTENGLVKIAENKL
jgi:ligand-binding sensor domain-containing protein